MDKSFRLIEFSEDNQKVVKLLETRKVSLAGTASDIPVEAFVEIEIDSGVAATEMGNTLVMRYSDGKKRIYCYHKAVLHQGGYCQKFMTFENKLVYSDEKDFWWVNDPQCKGVDPLGQYVAPGMWFLIRPKSVQVTVFLDNKAQGYNSQQPRIKIYKNYEEMGHNPHYYIFKKRGGGYDVIAHNHNNMLFFMDNWPQEEVEKIRQNPDKYTNPEWAQEFGEKGKRVYSDDSCFRKMHEFKIFK